MPLSAARARCGGDAAELQVVCADRVLATLSAVPVVVVICDVAASSAGVAGFSSQTRPCRRRWREGEIGAGGQRDAAEKRMVGRCAGERDAAAVAVIAVGDGAVKLLSERRGVDQNQLSDVVAVMVPS